MDVAHTRNKSIGVCGLYLQAIEVNTTGLGLEALH